MSTDTAVEETEKKFNPPSRLQRVITDPAEVDRAKIAAHEEFLQEMQNNPVLAERITDALLHRWYAPRPRKSRATKIFEECGAPESIYLQGAA